MAELFFAALKNERVRRTQYPTREHARRDVVRYIEFWYKFEASAPGFSTGPLSRSARSIWNSSPQRELTTNTLSGKLRADHDDFTDTEALAAVARITSGNFRLVQCLLTQVQRIMEINNLSTITKEVIETARESLVIGSL